MKLVLVQFTNPDPPLSCGLRNDSWACFFSFFPFFEHVCIVHDSNHASRGRFILGKKFSKAQDYVDRVCTDIQDRYFDTLINTLAEL